MQAIRSLMWIRQLQRGTSQRGTVTHPQMERRNKTQASKQTRIRYGEKLDERRRR